MTNKYDIYIFLWNYDVTIRTPVKVEIEIHNFISDLTEDKIIESSFYEVFRQMILTKSKQVVPFVDRERWVQFGFEHIEPSLKPPDKVVKYELYYLVKEGRPPFIHVDEEKGEINV